MSTKENNEVAVEKIDHDKGDAKCEIKGTKRAAEVSWFRFFSIIYCSYICGIFIELLTVDVSAFV